ncbi:glycoside hydrolase family 2 protein [Psychromicrobium sp. YIM B11713]|uniref:glycoside hydrolase family 2 protein n=1 Tax=Psychromicrobium sp. YIM B11713 TaxID=3145233 RepID=UPI00374E2F11
MNERITRNLLTTAAWKLSRTSAGAAGNWDEYERLGTGQKVTVPCTVPGTAAAAWREAFGLEAALELDFDAWDWWFIAEFEASDESGHTVQAADFHSAGIASYATVWLNGEPLLESHGAFDELSGRAALIPGRNRIALHCRPLDTVATPRKPRPRWRSSLAANTSLRWHRTPLLGHIPWHGTAKTVGPWAALSLRPQAAFELSGVRTELGAQGGRISIGLIGHHPTTVSARLDDPQGKQVAQRTFELQQPGVADAVLEVAAPQRWFPHTHGEPRLYKLSLSDGETQESFELGFRTVTAERKDGGFSLSVNGLPVHCRGAVWQPLDTLSLNASEEEYRLAVDSMVRAGANLLRISGTNVYEQAAFYQECDRQGVLVWQDCMLATFDPPEDPEWLAHFAEETSSWLKRLAPHPSLAVLSGGNETEQQPAFWGLPAESRTMTVLDQLIPELASRYLPDAVQVSSSPSGGESPIDIRQGISHYFGVGAYQLPLSDARTSGVRFAAEALAFANPAEPSTVQEHFPHAAEDTDQPTGWLPAVAADPGADWNFEDTAQHYAQEFFGVEAEAPWSRQLDLRRAAIHHAIRQTMTEWRRPESSCDGALLLSARDLAAGAGWGITDSEGRPKSAWYGLKAASAATALAIVPEALNGLDLYLFHDRPESLNGKIVLTLSSVAGRAIEPLEVSVQVAGHSTERWSMQSLLKGFRDLDYIWKFGDREYDCLEATLFGADGSELYRTVQLLGGIHRPLVETGLKATVQATEWIEVSTEKLSTFVALDLIAHDPADNYFHLPPGTKRLIHCRPRASTATAELSGTVRALNNVPPAQPVTQGNSSPSKGNIS